MPTANTKPQEVASTEYVKGAFAQIQNEVYTKKAIDEAIQDMVHAMGKLQQELEEANSKIENKYSKVSGIQIKRTPASCFQLSCGKDLLKADAVSVHQIDSLRLLFFQAISS